VNSQATEHHTKKCVSEADADSRSSGALATSANEPHTNRMTQQTRQQACDSKRNEISTAARKELEASLRASHTHCRHNFTRVVSCADRKGSKGRGAQLCQATNDRSNQREMLVKSHFEHLDVRDTGFERSKSLPRCQAIVPRKRCRTLYVQERITDFSRRLVRVHFVSEWEASTNRRHRLVGSLSW